MPRTQSSMMTAIIYLSHENLFDFRASLPSLKKKLKQLRKSSVLTNLAVINNLYTHSEFVGRGMKDLPEIQRTLKRGYLRPELNELVLERGMTDLAIFVRLQTLFLAKLAILYCNEESTLVADGETHGGFLLGECCLEASDLLLSILETRRTSAGTHRNRIRHLGFQLSPGSELSQPLDFLYGVVRSDIIYDQIIPSLRERISFVASSKSLDLTHEFENTVGISVAEYIDITIALLAYFLSEEKERPINWIKTIETESFLKQSSFPKRTFENYLRLESTTIEQLEMAFKANEHLHKQYGYLPFKSKPLIEIRPGWYFCIDTSFLSEKLNAGLYWKIFDNLNSKQRKVFSSTYGHVFELYVRRLLEESLRNPRSDFKKGLLFSDPVNKDGTKSFDEIIFYPDTKHLVVIESKASFIAGTAKYGRSIRHFWTEIRKKFVQNEAGSAKGVGQLANHIGKLFHESRSVRQRIDDSELDHWIQIAEKISPVLVVQEPVICFHINEGILNEEFRDRISKFPIRAGVHIQNLTVMNVNFLEVTKQHLIDREFTIEQALNYRNLRDPEYKNDFAQLTFQNFRLKEKRDKLTALTFKNAFDRATIRLFGDTGFKNQY